MIQLKFATEHVIWTEEEWDCVQFSNESKFNLFGCDGRRFVQRSPKKQFSPRCTKSHVKFGGGSVMIGMITVACTGPLVRLHSKINAAVYKVIMKKHVPNLRTVFMQDNTLCHTAKFKTFLSEEDVTVMEWAAQSPNMNPIEDVWKLLNERAKEKNPRNDVEL